MKKLLFILGFFILGINNVYGEEYIDATLVKCVDGDTVDLLVEGVEKRYRLLAIDTPESVKPNTEVEAYGKDASQYTCDMLTNAKIIKIEYDSLATKDKYDRELVWLWADNRLVQEALVTEGLAEVAYVYDNYKYVEELCLTQKVAKIEKNGIWSENREEGYCDTISREYQMELEKLEKIKDTSEKISEGFDKANKIVDNLISSDKFTLYVIIILLVVAAINEIRKSTKK